MKKQILLAAVALIAASCTSDNDTLQTESTVTNPEPAQVTLTFSPYDMQQMTRAEEATVPPLSSGVHAAPQTRAAAVADFATRLDIWLYSDDTEVAAAHQTKDDADFATLSLTLDKRRTYTLYAVAHKGTAPATLADGVITFPDDKVTHTFYHTQTFTPADVTQLACQMERIVGQFRMDTTDAIPDEATLFDIHIGTSPTAWSTATGGTNPQDRHATYSGFAKKSDGTASFSCFIIATAAEATSYTITVTAYDQGGTALQQRTFPDVPIRNGYRTTYRGLFFKDQPFTATFTAADWQDYDVTEF